MVLSRRLFVVFTTISILISYPSIAQEENSTKQTADYAESLSTLAKANFKKGAYKKADSLYIEALVLTKNVLSDSSSLYVSILSDYIELRVEDEKLEGLKELIDHALKVKADIYGKNSPEYARDLSSLGYYLINTFNYNEAENPLNEAARIQKNPADGDILPYIRTLVYQATLNIYTQKTSKSELQLIQAIELSKSIGEKEEKSKNTIILAALYSYSGRINEAVELYSSALQTYKEAIGEQHPGYAFALSYVAEFYYMIGDYDQAKTIILKALDLMKKNGSIGHRNYITSLEVIAYIYNIQGMYKEAEKINLEAIDICKKFHGEASPHIISIYQGLSTVYVNLANYDKAEETLMEAFKIVDLNPKAFKNIHTNLFNALGVIYLWQDHYEKALTTFQKAYADQKNNNLINNALTFTIINNICTTLLENPDTDISLVDDYITPLLGSLDSNLSAYKQMSRSVKNNIAEFYTTKGQYNKAFELYEQIIENYKSEVGETNWNYFYILSNYSIHLDSAGDKNKAFEKRKRGIEIMQELVTRDLLFLSEEESEQYWKSRDKYVRDLWLMTITEHRDNTGDLYKSLAYDCQLFAKNILLSSAVNKQKLILQSGDEELIELWREMKLLRNKSNNESNEQERELISKLDEMNITNEFSINWRDVQKMLNDNEVAIEIVNTVSNGHGVYYALILKSDSQHIEMQLLCSEEDIKTAIKQSKDAYSRLYDLIWRPMSKYLEDVNSVYISPSGLVNNVSFASLRNREDDKYISDQYTIHNLLSTRDIAKVKENTNSSHKRDIALFGGAYFELSDDEIELAANIEKNTISSARYRNAVEGLRYGREQGFDYLPGSLAEVHTIGDIARSAKWNVSLFTGAEALEGHLKSFSSRSPKVLHISTHGFYFDPPSEIEDSTHLSSNRFKYSENPLMRSGLAFSGANRIWTDKEESTTMDDGVLTAAEIANLDFSNTELVVLSACQTGLGDIDYNEGIYGLQRAFRLAGAQCMIISLWEVPDKETNNLMSEFYSNWTRGLSIKEAFTKAQNELKKIYPDSPYKWAGFILVE